MSDISEALRSELQDPEYSEGYAESFLNSYVATQIKVIREQRQWTQSELASQLGTTQTAISRIENVNYSAWNIKTLKKLARAFRVRLKVSFETFGTLPEEVEEFTRGHLQRPAREEDPGLWQRIEPQSDFSEKQQRAIAHALNPRTTDTRAAGEKLVVMPQPAFIAAQKGTPNGTICDRTV